MNDQTTTAHQGKLLGGILLVAGCCIGAGMLGLPVLSAQAGFKPSVVMFLFAGFSWSVPVYFTGSESLVRQGN